MQKEEWQKYYEHNWKAQSCYYLERKMAYLLGYNELLLKSYQEIEKIRIKISDNYNIESIKKEIILYRTLRDYFHDRSQKELNSRHNHDSSRLNVSNQTINDYYNELKTKEEKNKNSVEICVQDYNGEYWLFYAYIHLDNFENDIENIKEKIKKENFRDGDYRGMMIDNEDLEGFYRYMNKAKDDVLNDILNVDFWFLLQEKNDFHFTVLNSQYCTVNIEDAKNLEFAEYESWEDAFKEIYTDVYKLLEKYNMSHCFDYERYLNETGNYEEIYNKVIEITS